MRLTIYFILILSISARLASASSLVETLLNTDHLTADFQWVEKLCEEKASNESCDRLRYQLLVVQNLLYVNTEIKQHFFNSHEAPPQVCLEMAKSYDHLGFLECVYLGISEAMQYELLNLVTAKCTGSADANTLANAFDLASKECPLKTLSGFYSCLSKQSVLNSLNSKVANSLKEVAVLAEELDLFQKVCREEIVRKHGPPGLEEQHCKGDEYELLTRNAINGDWLQRNVNKLSEWQPGFEPKNVPDYFYLLNSCENFKKNSKAFVDPSILNNNACIDDNAKNPCPVAHDLAKQSKSIIEKMQKTIDQKQIHDFLLADLEEWSKVEKISVTQASALNEMKKSTSYLNKTVDYYLSRLQKKDINNLETKQQWLFLEDDFDSAIEKYLEEVARKEMEKKENSEIAELSLEPDKSSELLKQRTHKELVAYAKQVLKDAAQKKPDQTDSSSFWIESESSTPEGYTRFHEAWIKFQDRYREIGKSGDSFPDKEITFTKLLEALNSDFVNKYTKRNGFFTDFLKGDGGNCVAESKLIWAVLKDVGLDSFDGKKVLLQNFADHVQMVLYDPKAKTVTSLVSGEVVSGIEAPLYDPRILFYAYLNFEKEKPGIDSSKLLLVDQDPGLPPQPGGAQDSELASGTNARTSVRNGLEFPDGERKFTLAEVPDHASISEFRISKIPHPPQNRFDAVGVSSDHFSKVVKGSEARPAFVAVYSPEKFTEIIGYKSQNGIRLKIKMDGFDVYNMQEPFKYSEVYFFDQPKDAVSFSTILTEKDFKRRNEKKMAFLDHLAEQTRSQFPDTPKGKEFFGFLKNPETLIDASDESFNSFQERFSISSTTVPSETYKLLVKAETEFLNQIAQHPASFLSLIDKLPENRRYAFIGAIENMGREVPEKDWREKLQKAFLNPMFITFLTDKVKPKSEIRPAVNQGVRAKPQTSNSGGEKIDADPVPYGKKISLNDPRLIQVHVDASDLFPGSDPTMEALNQKYHPGLAKHLRELPQHEYSPFIFSELLHMISTNEYRFKNLNITDYKPKSVYSRWTPEFSELIQKKITISTLPDVLEVYREISASRPPKTRLFHGPLGELIPRDVALLLLRQLNSKYDQQLLESNKSVKQYCAELKAELGQKK